MKEDLDDNELILNHSPFRYKSITPGLSFQHRFPILSGDLNTELCHRLCLVHTQHLRLGRDGIPNKYRGRKLPVLAKEDGTWSRHIHSYQSVEQTRGQSTLDHQFLEFGFGNEFLIKMERIVVPAQLGIGLYMLGGEGEAAGGFWPLCIDFTKT